MQRRIADSLLTKHMDVFPHLFWLGLGFVVAALLVSEVLPLLAVALGMIAAVLLVALLLGGGG